MSQDAQLVETDRQRAIVIRTNKAKVLVLAILSLAFVVVGIAFMQSSQNFGTGLVVFLFFGLALLVFLFQIFTPSLLFLIDDEGLHTYYPFWHPRTILWEEVACLRFVRASFSSSLTVDVSPSGKQAYIARNYAADRVPSRFQRENIPMAFSILLTLSTISQKRLKTLVQERYAEQIERYRIVL